jgi:hypothetical protein
MIRSPLLASLVLTPFLLSGCFEATFPLGERGRYGEAYVGYRLPQRAALIISETPLLRDK